MTGWNRTPEKTRPLADIGAKVASTPAQLASAVEATITMLTDAAAIDAMLTVNPHGAVKLAPAADVPDTWIERCEREWISRDGECRQLVAWFGRLTSQPGIARATAITAGGAYSFVGSRLRSGERPSAGLRRRARPSCINRTR